DLSLSLSPLTNLRFGSANAHLIGLTRIVDFRLLRLRFRALCVSISEAQFGESVSVLGFKL
ncbi:hypothetical protein PanWU01x14_035670, partial [Parasponia andersonii]